VKGMSCGVSLELCARIDPTHLQTQKLACGREDMCTVYSDLLETSNSQVRSTPDLKKMQLEIPD
jgi:hypothetical protein